MWTLTNKLLLASLSVAALAAVPASAAVILTSQDGSSPYTGPTPTFNFDSPTPEFTGGVLKSTSDGSGAQPFGSTGSYASVNPNMTGNLNLSAFGDIDWISFIWGSIDPYNTLDVLDDQGVSIASFTGTQVIQAANGNQTDPATNRLVKLTFTEADRANVNSLSFRTTSPAFEIDNVSVAGAVPEPTTWMLMLLGMAGIGFSMRRKEKQTLRVRFA